MPEALARGSEDVGGLLHLVLLVTGSLGILDQRRLLFLAHFVKLLLGFFELTQVTSKEERFISINMTADPGFLCVSQGTPASSHSSETCS